MFELDSNFPVCQDNYKAGIQRNISVTEGKKS